jgi:hypothetical protein
MLKLGNLIAEDIFIIENQHLVDLQLWKSHYHYHLVNNEFKSFKIGIPVGIDSDKLKEVEEFLNSTSINYSIFKYFELPPEVSISQIIEIHPEYIQNKQVHILANKDILYKNIGAEFWDLSIKGIEVVIYKAERIKECQKHLSMYKRYTNKGVLLGFTATPKHSFGIMHKNRYSKLCNDGNIDFWITETIDTADAHYLFEVKLKTEIILAKMQKG